MYCKNCGNFTKYNNQNCIICNSRPSKGQNYCGHCGTASIPNTSYCMICGKQFDKVGFFAKVKFFIDSLSKNDTRSKKSTLIFGIIAGFTGIHNFYLGYNAKGLIQLLLFIFNLGFFSYIWSMVELIMILTGRINKDANGKILAE